MPTHRWLRTTLGVAAVAALALAGCGDDDDDASGSNGGDDTEAEGEAPETINEGQLAVCSDVPYEPMEMEGDGPSGYTGFDIELIDAISGDLEVVVSDVDFDGILGNLEAGSCDVVASSVTITEERAESVDFTDPYFDADQSLLVKVDSGITSLDDLAGETIGVQSGTTGEAYANENTPEGAQIRSFDGADALFSAIEAEDVVAVLQDFPINAYRTTQDDSLEVVETFTTEEQYGFAVRKGNESLLTFLNDGLGAARDDGTYDDLFETYFGTTPDE